MRVRVCLSLVCLAAAAAAFPQEHPSRSLYDRPGGAYPIAAVVDDFVERLLVNQVLHPPQPMLGQPAPAFELRDVRGGTVSLASLRGRFLVLHFGASW
jgi:hypothetical protein